MILSAIKQYEKCPNSLLGDISAHICRGGGGETHFLLFPLFNRGGTYFVFFAYVGGVKLAAIGYYSLLFATIRSYSPLLFRYSPLLQLGKAYVS